MTQANRFQPGTSPRTQSSPQLHPALSYSECRSAGNSLLDHYPRQAHAAWRQSASRSDAVHMVLQTEEGRMQELLPLRHGRMVRSAFTFYRGAARTMAYGPVRQGESVQWPTEFHSDDVCASDWLPHQ